MTRLSIGTCAVAVVFAACGDGDGGKAAVDAAVPDAAIADAAVVDAAGPDAEVRIDGGSGSNPGFIRPTETVTAYRDVGGAWELVGPANYACLGTPSGDGVTTVPVTLSGSVRNWQTGDRVEDVAIEVTEYPDGAAPVATTTADDSGDYSVVLPTGTGRVAIETSRIDGYHNLLAINVPLEAAAPTQTRALDIVSMLTFNAIPAFIGVSRTPGLGLVSGFVLDCDGNRVAGAIATVSNEAGVPAHRDGGQTYYFSAGTTSLPVRLSQRSNTNLDGRFVTIELPPGDGTYIQVWGFRPGQNPTTASLTLLCELPVSIGADRLSEAQCEPRRAE